MKKLATLCAIVFISLANTFTASAQDPQYTYYGVIVEDDPVFQKGDNLISVGYGFLHFINKLSTEPGVWKTSWGHAFVKYEWALSNIFGLGTQLYVGEAQRKADTYNDLLRSIGVGLYANLHFHKWIQVNHLDVYTGLGVSGKNRGYFIDANSPYALTFTDPARFHLDPVVKVGARYYIIPDIVGLYAEIAYDGMSDLQAGITVRF